MEIKATFYLDLLIYIIEQIKKWHKYFFSKVAFEPKTSLKTGILY